MDDRNTGYAQGIGSSDIGAFADSLADSLDRQMKVAFEPEERKSLRRFSSTEVAELLRVSASNLRNRHKDGSFPEVHTDGRGHRFYTAEEVDDLRNILARTGKNADAYRPGRRDGDRLQVISVVNFKGGSSKTTGTIHLAHRYALRGYRVLVLDLDPQASLTTFFGFRPELEFAEGGTIYDALRYDDQVPLSEVIQKTYFHKLDMVPAGLMLSEYETETANALARRVQPIFAERLALALEEVDSDYDIVLIDCPPQLGFLTLTALAASTGLLVTVVPGMLDIASMSQFLKLASETVKAVEEAIGRHVTWDFVKFLITRYEPSDGPQTQMAGYLRSILAGQVMTEPMLKSTAISDAGMTQQTIYEVDPSQLIRKTIDRALTSVNSVADELEQTIQMAWGASLMARNIFNQPPKDEKESAAPSPAPVKSSKLPGSIGGLRDSLREITANSIRDIEPDRIDMDGLRDRLILEDSSIEDLAESIRKHGQQVPIMVRPSDQPDRYRIIYGRRRLAAIRRVGGTIKAIVRTLDDDASLIAQGQENNLRLDPSFIEKSLFIKEMQEAGYKPSVIQDALGLTRQGVSNHRVVIEQLPDELVRLIGPAHGVGRRQWGDLAALSEKVPLVEIARETLAPLPDITPSADKFQAVYVACSSKARGAANQSARGQTTVLKDDSGSPVGTLSVDGKSIAIKITRKDNPEFGQWLEERAETTLRQLFEQWQNERGSGN